jgi:formamidopyrimidine-DNA glycosylase
MPELPEVETVARQLRPRLTGRTVRAFRVLDPLLRRGWLPRLGGRRIVHVGRSGKRVLIGFSGRAGRGDELWLAVHLRMTGRLIWSGEGIRAPQAHLRARMRLDRGTLSFFDTRRFGTLEWYRDAKEADPPGVEPLSPALTGAVLERLTRGSRQNIKAWLLRQDRLVGLGNIYASEILHLAGISPLREAGSLDRRERRLLLGAIRKVLRRAIGSSGTTFSDFQDARGVAGSYQRHLRVYGREGEPCPRCAEAVVREVRQQRSTFWCPRCQR